MPNNKGIEKYAFTILNKTHGGIINRDGFWKTLRQTVGEFDGLDLDRKRVYPDGWVVDELKKEIFIWEIEDSSLLTRERLRIYTVMWFALDSENWDLFLFTTNRYGTHEQQISLFDYYYTIGI